MINPIISESRVTIHFDVHEPIELMDFSNSLSALSFKYLKFFEDLARSKGQKNIDEQDVKLFITEIKTNCIFAELAPYTPYLAAGAASAASELNNLYDFVKNVYDTIKTLALFNSKSKISARDVGFSKAELKAMQNLTKTVADSKNGEMSLGLNKIITHPDGTNEEVKFICKNKLVKDAHYGSKKALEILENTDDAQYKNEILRLYQTGQEEAKKEGRTAHKGVIQDISKNDVPILFVSDLDRIKFENFKSDPLKNPLTASFIVDVNATTNSSGKVVAYRVLNLHDIIPDEE
ncbi:MAG: hypothetical protein J0L55_02655 [Caulobacterales bacterium]|nr:hypothetical protein [Caulobacterales bacterium]MCA0372737.1 hypothetical protein [Pseudomonadota bacterium]